MRPLRILHVIPSLAWEDGGPTRALIEMETGLASAGLEVTTVATRPRSGPSAPPGAAGVRRIHARRWTTPYKVAPGLAFALPALLRRHDVLHTHALFSFAPNLAALTARSLGVPYIVRPLGTLSRRGLTTRRRVLKRASLACLEAPVLRGAAAVHFTSASERDEAQDLGIAMRSVVIPLGVSAEESAARPCDHPAFAGRTVVLFLSRLDPKKNLEGLMEALAGSERFAASAVLAVAGDGPPPYVVSLKALAREAGLGERVVWLGHVEGGRKSALLARADIFVLPSFDENFGIAAAEALAAGLPCLLGTGVALAGEVARAGAGLAVPPDPTALRAAVETLIGAPALRSEMGRRARALAAERFSAAAMTRRLVALYEEVGGARRDGSR